MKSILVILAFMVCFVNAKDTLRVAVSPLEPFVMKGADGELSGYDIDLIESIASYMNKDIKYIFVDSFVDVFSVLDSGKADLAISAISITPQRYEKYNFSYPYKNSGIGAMVRSEKNSSIFNSIGLVFTKDFMLIWVVFFIFLIVWANLIWIVERFTDIITKDTRPDTFNDKYSVGIFDSIWYVIVTVSTVGYGDKVPKHLPTRILSFFLILIGVSFAGLAISNLSASVQIEKQKYAFNTFNDFRGKKVAVITGTTSVETVIACKAKVISTGTLDSAIDLLRNNEVDAIFFDEPVLRYVSTQYDDVHVIDDIMDDQSYGIVLPQKNNIENSLNIAILKMSSKRKLDELNNKWFGD
jgi:polar amino acid transport system substrate-binding protein